MKPYPVWVEQIQDKDKADEQDCIVYGVAAKPDGWCSLHFTYLYFLFLHYSVVLYSLCSGKQAPWPSVSSFQLSHKLNQRPLFFPVPCLSGLKAQKGMENGKKSTRFGDGQ